MKIADEYKVYTEEEKQKVILHIKETMITISVVVQCSIVFT